MNEKHKDILNSANDKCNKITTNHDKSNELLLKGSKLLSDSSDILNVAADYFKKLGKTFENMKTIRDDMVCIFKSLLRFFIKLW